MNAVKVGQVWQDKDKRRGERRIEIIALGNETNGIDPDKAVGLIVGTEKEIELKVDRLTARWALITEKPLTLTPKVKDTIEEISAIEIKPKHKNREAWLEAAIKELTKLFVKLPGITEVPTVRVSVGWPGGRGKKQGVIGQCFATTSATDKVAQIFVSPVVVEPLKALVVVAHEMIHAVDDCKNGHKTGFIKIARELGFTPKWTVATPDTITPEFKAKLEAIAERLGTYPHAAIVPTERPVVQKTYMAKIISINDPDFFVRMTKGKIEEYGFPRDPWGDEMELEEK